MELRRFTTGLVAGALLVLPIAWAIAPHPLTALQPGVLGDDDEETIAFEQAPEGVRTAAIGLAGDAKNVRKVTRSVEDGAEVYEVDYTDGTNPCSAVFSAEGALMELEQGVSEASLPGAVRKALASNHPEATVASAERVTRTWYEVKMMLDGKSHKVRVDPTGNIQGKAKAEGAKKEKKKKEEKEKHEDADGEH